MLATLLHDFIEKTNFLHNPTVRINEFLREHRTVYKVALIVNHLFRAAMMAAFTFFLPFTAAISFGICLVGSLFYRLTVENNCAYKFALPSLAGSIAFLIGKKGINDVISKIAFGSIAAFSSAFLSFLPLCAYIVYIALTVNYDVDHK